MKRQPKKQSTVPFIPVSLPDAHKKFVQSIPEAAEGSNSYVARFVQVVDYIMSTGRSFTFQDVARQTYQAEIPFEETRRLFAKWSEMMMRLGKLDVCEGVYDSPTYIVI